ncbi:MAG: hypothetical protein Q9174_004946 [Haloplaca sp. 1 TL-2023]
MADNEKTLKAGGQTSDEDSPAQPPPSHDTTASVDQKPPMVQSNAVENPKSALELFNESKADAEAFIAIHGHDMDNLERRRLVRICDQRLGDLLGRQSPYLRKKDTMSSENRRRHVEMGFAHIMPAPATTTAPTAGPAASTTTTSQPALSGPAPPGASSRPRRSLRLSGGEPVAITDPMDLENDEEHVGHDDDDSPDEEWTEDPADEEIKEEEEAKREEEQAEI